MTEELVVSRLIASREDGGAIFQATRFDGSTLQAVAGREVMPRSPVEGEIWAVTGSIRQHPRYGTQFVINQADLVRPSGRLIVDFIARNPAFPGIGHAKAKALWDRFGEELGNVLDADEPELIESVVGGPQARSLLEGWRLHRAEAETISWLDQYGFSRAIAGKTLAVWGDQAPEKLRQNPYRMLAFAPWSTTDKAARTIGVTDDDDRRLIAGVEAAFYRRLGFGHTACSERDLNGLVEATLSASSSLAAQAIRVAIDEKVIIKEGTSLQPIGLWSMEAFVRERVSALSSRTAQGIMIEDTMCIDAVSEAERAEQAQLNEEQRLGVVRALQSGISVLTGGAGVGKTQALRVLATAGERIGIQVVMMALAGRAASKLRETTGRKAYTIAAFLNAVRRETLHLAQRHLIVVDEASMLDLPLFYRLLRALPKDTAILLVGDPYQLPPIGFGLVFHLLAASSALPVTTLTRIYRQASESGIPAIAAEIRSGSLPDLPTFDQGATTGVSLIEASPADIASVTVATLEALGGTPHARVIGPLRTGPAGMDRINRSCHIRRDDDALITPGEPVIYEKNDYDRGLFNGSLGVVAETLGNRVTIDFDDGQQTFEGWDPNLISLAYGITVHKAQGSSFSRVIIPFTKSRLLDRTMIYTAITRATDQVVLVGERKVLKEAVHRPPTSSMREVGLSF